MNTCSDRSFAPAREAAGRRQRLRFFRGARFSTASKTVPVRCRHWMLTRQAKSCSPPQAKLAKQLQSEAEYTPAQIAQYVGRLAD